MASPLWEAYHSRNSRNSITHELSELYQLMARAIIFIKAAAGGRMLARLALPSAASALLGALQLPLLTAAPAGGAHAPSHALRALHRGHDRQQQQRQGTQRVRGRISCVQCAMAMYTAST